MKRRYFMKTAVFFLMIIFCMTGCKKTNLGAEEDNPMVTETELKPEYVIGVSLADLDNPYYATLKKVIVKSAQEEGHKVLVKNPKNDSDTQIEQIEWMIGHEVDAVILAPADREQITPALDKFKEAKVKVLNVGTRVEQTDAVDSYIGADNHMAGRLCGKELVDKMPDGGSVLILEQEETSSINERILGFEEAVASHGFEILQRLQVESNEESARKKVERALKKNPDAEVIMCGDDQMALGALKAVTESGRKDIFIYSIDGSPSIKEELEKENSPVIATIGQSLSGMGRRAVQAAIQLLDGEKIEKEILEDPFLIDKENVGVYGTDGWS